MPAEVSSHGLDQGRVNGVQAGGALFTNLPHHLIIRQHEAVRSGEGACPLGRLGMLSSTSTTASGWAAASLDRSRLNVLGYGLGKGEISASPGPVKRGLSLEIKTPGGGHDSQRTAGRSTQPAGRTGIGAAGIGLDDATRTLEQLEPVPAGYSGGASGSRWWWWTMRTRLMHWRRCWRRGVLAGKSLDLCSGAVASAIRESAR